MEEILKTVIDKETGQELRAQFHDTIAENEMLIEALRTEPITGGTVFWLNAGIDRGDIAYQDWCWIPPEYFLEPQKSASKLWKEELLPMGLKLFEIAFKDLLIGVIKRTPHDKRFSTFEPDTSVKDIYKPDLLMLEYIKSHN